VTVVATPLFSERAPAKPFIIVPNTNGHKESGSPTTWIELYRNIPKQPMNVETHMMK